MTVQHNIRRAIKRFENAVINKTWKGSQPPETWDEIEETYKRAKEHLFASINAVQHKE